MKFSEKVLLGNTNLKVGRLGISSSYGASADVYEEAFEHGLNYFTWGTFIKGKSGEMKKAIQNLVKKGKREELVISLISYAHISFLNERNVTNALKKFNIDYIDSLLLGYYSKMPPKKITDHALRLKEKGLVKNIGFTGHNRKIFVELNQNNLLDLFHIRYNAVHRGAETQTFPFISDNTKPGIVSFTATSWGQLINPKKTPTAVDCYRFVLSNPSVDVCMMGVKNSEQLRENLSVLDSGPMTKDELKWMRKIGNHIYNKK
ncbi:aldo/keto reductase [Bacteroidota bacterium]